MSKEIVGFCMIGNEEYIIGKNNKYFYFINSSYAHPNLDFFDEGNIEYCKTINEFEKLYETKVYQKDLWRFFKDKLKSMLNKFKLEDGKYILEWKLNGAALKFDVTEKVEDLTNYVDGKENKNLVG